MGGIPTLHMSPIPTDLDKISRRLQPVSFASKPYMKPKEKHYADGVIDLFITLCRVSLLGNNLSGRVGN